MLNNGLGHYQALTAAHRAAVSLWELGFSNRAVIELIEAAARSGMSQTAASAYRRLAEITGCYVRTNRRPQGDLLPPGIGDLEHFSGAVLSFALRGSCQQVTNRAPDGGT